MNKYIDVEIMKYEGTYISILPVELRELLTLYYYGHIVVNMIGYSNINSDNSDIMYLYINIILADNFFSIELHLEIRVLLNFFLNTSDYTDFVIMDHTTNKMGIGYMNNRITIQNYTANHCHKYVLNISSSKLLLEKMNKLAQDVNTYYLGNIDNIDDLMDNYY